MKKIAFIIDSLGNSDQNLSLITNLNRLVIEGYSVTAFYEQWEVPPISPLFSILFKNEIFSYKGPVVATNRRHIDLLLSAYSISNRYFYIWDIDWHLMGNYPSNSNIFHHPSLKYLTRSESHRDHLKKIWGTQSEVVKEFSYDEIKRYAE